MIPTLQAIKAQFYMLTWPVLYYYLQAKSCLYIIPMYSTLQANTQVYVEKQSSWMVNYVASIIVPIRN